MRLAIVFLALATVLLAWFARSSDIAPTASTLAGETAAIQSFKPRAPAAPIEADPAPPEPATARTTVEPTPQSTIDTESSRCRVFGRVLDADGRPLPDVHVRMTSVGEPWIEGERPEELDENGGVSAETDESGRFSFDLPFPTSSWISLWIRPGPYHAITNRYFGLAGGRNADPLVPGDNDLGDLVLAPTGAIEGMVRGQGHGPLAKATATVDTPSTTVISGSSDESGRWLIGNVQPGTFAVGLRREGYLSANTEPVEVRAGATSTVPVIELERAPTVQGHIVDEQGTAAENVRVWGWPLSTGRGAGDRTDENGRFSVNLPQDEPYRFEFSHPDFVKTKRHSGLVLDPGTTDAVVVLQRAPKMTFRVVDRAGQRIGRFGLRVEAKSASGGSRSREPQPFESHPNGEVTLPASPESTVYCIEAPGFAPRRDIVAPDVQDGAVQTITLEPGSVFWGRVLFEGRPVSNASVRVERSFYKVHADAPEVDHDNRWLAEGYGYDLNEFTGRQRRALTRDDGRFRLEDLPAGTFSVTVSAEVGAPLEIAEVPLGTGVDVDLGKLELTAGATVRGRITVGREYAPGGVEVYLDRTWDEPVGTSAADGSFRIEGLSPGEHSIVIDESSGLVVAKATFPFLAIAGESVDVDIDLRALHSAKLAGRVFVNGEPATGARIRLRVPSTGSQRGLATTSETGIFAAECAPSDEPLELVVHSAGGLPLGVHREPVELITGGEANVTIQLEVGELILVMPDDWVLPPSGSAVGSIQFKGSGLSGFLHFRHSGAEAHTPPNSFDRNGPRISLGTAMTGLARIYVNAQIRDPEEIDLAPPQTRGEVRIVAGETAECRLAPMSGPTLVR